MNWIKMGMTYESYPHDLVFKELAAKTVKLSADKEALPMFFALKELTRVCVWSILS